MGGFDYQLLLLRLFPETTMVVGALIILFLDQVLAKTRSLIQRSNIAVGLGVLTMLLTITAITQQTSIGRAYGGMLSITDFTRVVKLCVLLLGIGTLLVGSPSRFTAHVGEYVALVLMGMVGLLFLAGTEELLTAFIALELTSLSLYLLTGFHKGNIYSAEAALKYFLFGSVAAAFTLFGLSLVYGLAGDTSFVTMAANLRTQSLSPLLVVALVLTAIGFAFKMAAAPLHLWAPDAYQGAPIPSAALIASGSKLVSFILFFRLFVYALAPHSGDASLGDTERGWAVILAAMAATSMIAGNLLAIAQTNVRRLLAYSAVAHAGYVLIGILTGNSEGGAAAVYYLFTYGLSVIGAFGVVGLLEKRAGTLSIQDLTGLSRRAPSLALCLLVFVLSLAGIPPLAGFFGKFYLFLGALESSKTAAEPGLLWIVILALAASAVSLYYYLQLLKMAFVAETHADAELPLQIPRVPVITLVLLASGIVYFGCFPEPFIRMVHKAIVAEAPTGLVVGLNGPVLSR